MMARPAATYEFLVKKVEQKSLDVAHRKSTPRELLDQLYMLLSKSKAYQQTKKHG